MNKSCDEKDKEKETVSIKFIDYLIEQTRLRDIKIDMLYEKLDTCKTSNEIMYSSNAVLIKTSVDNLFKCTYKQGIFVINLLEYTCYNMIIENIDVIMKTYIVKKLKSIYDNHQSYVVYVYLPTCLNMDIKKEIYATTSTTILNDRLISHHNVYMIPLILDDANNLLFV
jgi:hypothetical protein